jgi:HSP20 family protein
VADSDRHGVAGYFNRSQSGESFLWVALSYFLTRGNAPLYPSEEVIMILNHRHPLGSLWQEFNQVQDEFAKWFGRANNAVAVPQLSVWDDENAVYAEADLPGIDPAKLEVTVTEGDQLNVQGERVPPNVSGAVWVRQERPFGKFSRAVRLPSLVDADKVEAKYENGVLRLTLPKHEAAKPRKIVVKGE